MDLGSDINFSGIGRSELEDLRGDTIIKVIGVGGAGGSVVRRMIRLLFTFWIQIQHSLMLLSLNLLELE